MQHPLTLTLLPDTFAVCQLAPTAPIPAWADAGHFTAITRTADELSIVCRQEHIPDDITAERGWRCLKVAGPLDFALTGILAALAAPLAQAGISIFALSTYATDYLLVKEASIAQAMTVLRDAGWIVQGDI
jgi:hypothetical protein